MVCESFLLTLFQFLYGMELYQTFMLKMQLYQPFMLKMQYLKELENNLEFVVLISTLGDTS